MKTAETAKEFLKNRGLKNPPLDSGISGGGDAPRRYASDLMEAYASQFTTNNVPVDKVVEIANLVRKETLACAFDYNATHRCNDMSSMKLHEYVEKELNFDELIKNELAKSLPTDKSNEGAEWIRVKPFPADLSDRIQGMSSDRIFCLFDNGEVCRYDEAFPFAEVTHMFVLPTPPINNNHEM